MKKSSHSLPRKSSGYSVGQPWPLIFSEEFGIYNATTGISTCLVCINLIVWILFVPFNGTNLNLCFSAAFKTQYKRMENKLCNDPARRERQKWILLLTTGDLVLAVATSHWFFTGEIWKLPLAWDEALRIFKRFFSCFIIWGNNPMFLLKRDMVSLCHNKSLV